MKTLKAVNEVKTREEATCIAINWQNWAKNMSMSYGELSEYQNYFINLAKKFDLIEEFIENGII